MRRARDISDIMEAFNVGLLKLRVAHCFSDPCGEVLQSSCSLFLVSEAVYMDEWEPEGLWISRVFAPNVRVGVLKKAYKSI